jgi:peptidoglycan DL-endopeptidase CwlO
LATYRTRTIRIVAVAASASLLGVAFLPGIGQAQPKLTLAQAEARVNALQNQAEVAQEQVNSAELAAGKAILTLADDNARIAQAEAALAGAKRSIGQLAAVAYKSGGVDETLQLLLADNPTQFLAQASVLNGISRHQEDVLRTVAAASDRLAQVKLAAAQQVGLLQQLRKRALTNQDQVQSLVKQAQNVLNSLQASQKAALARQQAASRAQQQALVRMQQANNNSNASRPSVSYAPPPSGGGGGGNLSIGQRALAYAMAQIGKAYVYAGTGPNAYDCSGLTMMAYRSVGISLSHSSFAQWDEGRHISVGDLQPGDLVFWYQPMHHVGMYIGGGMVVHAANPSSGVLESPLMSMPYDGAVRPY